MHGADLISILSTHRPIPLHVVSVVIMICGMCDYKLLFVYSLQVQNVNMVVLDRHNL